MNDAIEVDTGPGTRYINSRTNPAIMGGFTGSGAGKTDSTTLGYLNLGLLTNSINIDALLKAEEEITEAKLLANPRILVLDNEQATFDIVTEHPYVERTISGDTITETVKFKEVGIKLVVTPHVTRDGMVRLHILPEFGVRVGQVMVSSNNVPIVDTRKVNTIALVRDGQTVVLGGMRKKAIRKQTNKIPLLGDIPILGGLFRFEGEDTAVTELIVFITPRIVPQEPVLSLDEHLALEETKFSMPKSSSTKAEKKIAEESSEE
jgi:type II secretory pathway component GspD/PulD (secretin)